MLEKETETERFKALPMVMQLDLADSRVYELDSYAEPGVTVTSRVQG